MLWAWLCASAGLVLLAARRHPPALERRPAEPTRVLLIRPCCGVGRGIAEAVRSLPPWPPGVHLTWVGAVADEDDPAWPLVSSFAAELRREGWTAHALTTNARGPNRKAEQLEIAMEHLGEGHDVVLVADADADLEGLDVKALVRSLGARDHRGRPVGLTWASPFEIHASSWGDRASKAILDASWHAFALLHRLDPHLVVGKTFAMRTIDLDRLGGFGPLRHVLGEDFELGRRVELLGLSVHRVGIVPSRVHDRSLRDVVERYVRWLWVVRAQRPWRLLGYPLLLAAAPLQLFVCAGLAPWSPKIAVAGALWLFVTRLAVALLARRVSHGAQTFRVRGDLRVLDAWLADLVLLMALASVLGRRHLRWAHRTLRVAKDGSLQAASEAPQDRARECRE